MNESPQPLIYKFSVSALTSIERANQLTGLIKHSADVVQVDVNLEKRLVRIISRTNLPLENIKPALAVHGFHLQQIDAAAAVAPVNAAPSSSGMLTVGITGMTCRSCELTIERKWKKLPGIKHVDANVATGKATLQIAGHAPSLDQLQSALGSDTHYKVHRHAKHNAPAPTSARARPSGWRIVGLFALVLLLAKVLEKLGLFNTNFSVGDSVSFGAIFVIGLVAASSSCIAVTGGLLLSTTARFNARYASARSLSRMRPVALFVAGRIAGYTLFGGILGGISSIVAPSPTVTAVIAIVAALYMLIMGLDMLQIAPTWSKRLLPRMPKRFSHRIMDAEHKEHPLAPVGLGAATFFLPCGFTQALQLYALTTGSFTTGALTLLAFALGTAPALLALGWASSSIKGKVGRLFFQFSGALVVVLGLWNMQNSLAILGYPINLPSLGGSTSAQAAQADAGQLSGTMEKGVQVIQMGFQGNYYPNQFTLRVGVPVRWDVDGSQTRGCASVLISRQLGLQKALAPGINSITFTPEQPGEISFSCSMGMYRGSFTVLPAA